MSPSVELQTAVYERLVADAGVTALVSARVYDNPPRDAVFPFISFGPSDYVTDDMACIAGRTETLQIDVWSRRHGKLREARAISDAVKAALHLYEPDLGTNALVLMRVDSVRVFRDADGVTGHGVVTIEAEIEEVSA